MKTKYYYLHINEDDGEVARAPLENKIEFVEEILDYSVLPFQFKVEKKCLQDYQSNDLSWILFSKKMYDIFIDYSSNKFKWVSTSILDPILNKNCSYYVFCPLKDIDVLNVNKSIFAGNDFVVKAVFDVAKVKNLKMFFIPGSSFRLVVHEEIKEKIINCKCTGIEFSEVLVK